MMERVHAGRQSDLIGQKAGSFGAQVGRELLNKLRVVDVAGVWEACVVAETRKVSLLGPHHENVTGGHLGESGKSSGST